eukprot:Gb_40404 [translate_table: standard]
MNSLQRLSILLLALMICSPSVRAADPPLGFAHYMLFQPDSVAVLKQQILLARSKGIDAFALNTNVWRQSVSDNMYEAAKEAGPDFKLFFSADIHKDNNGNLKPEEIALMLTRFKNHPNQLKYNGKQFLSAWLGSDDSWWKEYGYSTALDGWKDVFLKAGGKNNYFFVPFFPTDGSKYGVLGTIDKFTSIVDGLLSWDRSSWPYTSTDVYQNPTPAFDQSYLDGCKANNKIFKASVSPWFFKNVEGLTCCSAPCKSTDPDVTVNCGCQVKGNYQGPGLWIKRWQQLIQLKPPLVEIATWNDYDESSYIAPGLGLGVSTALDFPHRAFLELGEHYIRWYKSGVEPAITEDSLYMFYYTHSKNVNVAAEGCNVLHSKVLSDKLYVTTMLTQAATVELRSGNGVPQTFDAPKGIFTHSIDFKEGQQAASLKRGGAVVKTLTGAKPISNGGLSKYNFNVYTTCSKCG